MKKNRLIISTMLLFFSLSLCNYSFCDMTTISAEETEEKLISINFSDVEISDALNILSEEFGLNFIVGEDIKGKVTANFKNVTVDDALFSILKVNGYHYIKNENIIRIIKLTHQGSNTISKVFSLKHIDANNLTATIKNMLTEYGSVEIIIKAKGVGNEKTQGRSTTLLITDLATNLLKIEKVIQELDKPSIQVMIEAKIIEVGLGKDDSLGIDWSIKASASGASVPTILPFTNVKPGNEIPSIKPGDENFPPGKLFPYTSSGNFSFGRLDFSGLQAILNMIQSNSDFNILSSPKVITLDNQEANIHIGEVIPVPKYAYDPEKVNSVITGFDKINVGITLTVTPHITPDNYVIMNVTPEVSEITGWVKGQSGEDEIPKLSARKVETQLKIKNNETIVIGGLLKNNKTEGISKVPLLGDIPFLGALFRKKTVKNSRSDLLIFITCRIMTDNKIVEELNKTNKKIKAMDSTLIYNNSDKSSEK